MEPMFVPSSSVRVEDVPRVGRKLRKPQHNFIVRHRPFLIQPFLIAPVLPGDTLKNLLLQATVVTDPIKSSIMGWWNEFYFFYVKLRDLQERDAIEQMLMANSAPPAASAASLNTYYNGEGVNWTRKCLDRITDCYFRSEEEIEAGLSATYAATQNGESMPMAKAITLPGWMENLKADSDAPASDGTALPGDHWPELPEHLAGFAAAYEQWKQMQSLEMVPPTFESYLKTFGVTPPKSVKEDPHIPELIRYVRNFKMPSNTVGETGAINSQVVWNVAERADKDRFFAEPGFIFGVTTTRAKMYYQNQKASLSSFLNDAYSWLPALPAPGPAADAPALSMRSGAARR